MALLVKPDPKLDLVLTRDIDVPRELVWAAWTTPEHVMKWFTPRPWRTTECEIDLRPGGIFRTVMRGPEGEVSNNLGCYLEVTPNERLIWSDALHPGFRPSGKTMVEGLCGHFTAIICLEALGKNRTRYTATLLHSDEDTRKNHEDMGFYEGWGTALDQLVELARSM